MESFTERYTSAALRYILREMPFRVRSINSDNGSESINYLLQDFMKKEYKTCKVTRSRANFKNDNARDEERNQRLVREIIGDERPDDERFLHLLNQLYKWVNLQHNHFIASIRKDEGRRGKERFITSHESLNP